MKIHFHNEEKFPSTLHSFLPFVFLLSMIILWDALLFFFFLFVID